jgi:tripartite-type tricarboxylate transporter receptor subunit TctC
MKIPRRQFLNLTASAMALTAVPHFSWAAVYPTRPVRIVVGAPAGGGNDILGRLFAQGLSERLDQQFFVENRPGAGSNIGTEHVVHASADGYTLLLVSSSAAINATLYAKLNFDFIRDIAAVAGIVSVFNVMYVHPSFPASTIPEFISYAKANPGKITMASGGNGSSSHMAGELFKMMAGIDLLHIPYRGNAPALVDLLGGQVQVMFATAPGTTQYVTTGELRALAVTTKEPAEVLPGIPTLGEFVPGYEASQWYGLGAPKNTSAEIIQILNNGFKAELSDPKMKARFAEAGGSATPMTSGEFAEFIANETEKWAKVIKFADMKAG